MPQCKGEGGRVRQTSRYIRAKHGSETGTIEPSGDGVEPSRLTMLDGTNVSNELMIRGLLLLIVLLATFLKTSLCPLLTSVTEDLRC
jgi:hypothetical protein